MVSVMVGAIWGGEDSGEVVTYVWFRALGFYGFRLGAGAAQG